VSSVDYSQLRNEIKRVNYKYLSGQNNQVEMHQPAMKTYQNTVMVQHISSTAVVSAAVLELSKLVQSLDHLGGHLFFQCKKKSQWVNKSDLLYADMNSAPATPKTRWA
jgi:hypothetical protein